MFKCVSKSITVPSSIWQVDLYYGNLVLINYHYFWLIKENIMAHQCRHVIITGLMFLHIPKQYPYYRIVLTRWQVAFRDAIYYLTYMITNSGGQISWQMKYTGVHMYMCDTILLMLGTKYLNDWKRSFTTFAMHMKMLLLLEFMIFSWLITFLEWEFFPRDNHF